MVNLSTTFKVSTFKDMKGNAKCRNWGGFGRLGVTQGHWQHHHSIEYVWFPTWL